MAYTEDRKKAKIDDFDQIGLLVASGCRVINEKFISNDI